MLSDNAVSSTLRDRIVRIPDWLYYYIKYTIKSCFLINLSYLSLSYKFLFSLFIFFSCSSWFWWFCSCAIATDLRLRTYLCLTTSTVLRYSYILRTCVFTIYHIPTLSRKKELGIVLKKTVLFPTKFKTRKIVRWNTF